MRKYLFVFFLLASAQLQAQTKYFIYFSDKNGENFDPYSYFDEKAIERRWRENISLCDETDFPVKEEYICSINQVCDSVKFISRWLNGMSVYATQDQIEEVMKLSFVTGVQLLQSGKSIFSATQKTGDTYNLEKDQIALLKFQTFRHNAKAFQNAGLNGKGIRIAVFDVGFPGVDTHPAFEHIRKENRIIDVYDFIGNDKNPYHGNSHGTSCMSCIAGYYDTIPLGMATGAEFLLAKTERMYTEMQSEEDAWLAAAEWADKNGADIISSSLGYTRQRYDPADMDGKTSLVAKAARMASEKGILVVNAAGNEADGRWEYLGTPADVEEVLTVGGINPYIDAHISFSSFGPNAEYKLKPNVCSLGETIAANENKFETAFGTSFATPLVAGFAACAWQSNRALSRADIFNAIEHSAHLYPYFDYAHGYGVPQANFFTKTQQVKIAPTFQVYIVDESSYVSVEIDSTFFPDSLLASETKNFYYHFSDADGKIVYFSVIIPYEKLNSIYIPEIVLENREKYFFKAHFERYTFAIPLK